MTVYMRLTRSDRKNGTGVLYAVEVIPPPAAPPLNWVLCLFCPSILLEYCRHL